MIKAHRSVVVWRLVGPSSGAKTCPHVFSRHSSLSKHSHRVGDWLTNSSHHAKRTVMDHLSFYTLSGLSSSCVWHTATRPQRRYGKFFTVKPTVLPLLHCVLWHLPKLNSYSFWHQCWQESGGSSIYAWEHKTSTLLHSSNTFLSFPISWPWPFAVYNHTLLLSLIAKTTSQYAI